MLGRYMSSSEIEGLYPSVLYVAANNRVGPALLSARAKD